MYRMIVVTTIGNYVVEMTPEKEEPTNDDLMELFLNTRSDVEAGCFMEGWTPTDSLSSPPGVFAIGKGMDILAYHIEKVKEVPVLTVYEKESGVLPLTLKFAYLENEMIAKCVQMKVEDINVVFCYSVNGEPPTDVLNAKTLTEYLCKCVEYSQGYGKEEYLLQVSDDGNVRNFSQAVEALKTTIYCTPNIQEKPGQAGKGTKNNASKKTYRKPGMWYGRLFYETGKARYL